MRVSKYYDLEHTRRQVAAGEHRSLIGGHWEEVGILARDFAIDQGLTPGMTVLDIGCGCLRIGVKLVEYLDAGNYFGTDLSEELLSAGYDRELRPLGLETKLPRRNLLRDGEFEFDNFENAPRFDMALAMSLFTHLPLNHLRLCLEKLEGAMAPGAKLIATIFHCREEVEWSGPILHEPGWTMTYPARDPYHYRSSDLERCVRGLGWRVGEPREWNHPRGQAVVVFARETRSLARSAPGRDAGSGAEEARSPKPPGVTAEASVLDRPEGARPGEFAGGAGEQIIVFGMHRSGTSLLTRLLHHMGCFVGSQHSLMPANSANPEGYFERRDVVALNDRILASRGGDWLRAVDLDLEALAPGHRLALEREAVNILEVLEPRRPWALKDPRMCLTFPFWRRLLDRPICVLIHRSPLEAAKSLSTRDELPVPFGLAVWERYALSALACTRGLPRLLVSYHQLLDQPLAATMELYRNLAGLGVKGLREPDRAAAAIVDGELAHERADPSLEEAYLSPAQARLARALADRSMLKWEQTPALSAPSRDLLLSLDRTEASRIPRLQKEIEKRTRWAQDLGRTLEERGQTIRQLQAEIESRTRWAQDLGKTVEERDQTILELQAELESRTRWAQGLGKTVEERDQMIRQLQAELEDRTRWARDLAKAAEDSEALIRELQAKLVGGP